MLAVVCHAFRVGLAGVVAMDPCRGISARAKNKTSTSLFYVSTFGIAIALGDASIARKICARGAPPTGVPYTGGGAPVVVGYILDSRSVRFYRFFLTAVWYVRSRPRPEVNTIVMSRLQRYAVCREGKEAASLLGCVCLLCRKVPFWFI